MRADQVKFTDFHPPREYSSELLESARAFILETRPPEPETGEGRVRMRLAAPHFLLALPFCLLFLFWISQRARKGGRFRFSSLSVINSLPSVSGLQPRLILQVLRALAVGLFIIALARPQSGKRFTEITSEGVDIMLALDTSGSMKAIDMTIDDKPAERVDVVKKVAAEFVAKRPTDRIGSVVFAETAFLQCPLTLDHSMLVNLMNEIQVGVAGESTAIGDGIGVSVNHMKGLKAKSKVIILLTDGQNNSGLIPPLKAAELARTFGIKIYTIGVGVDGQAPFLVNTPFGKRVLPARGSGRGYVEADRSHHGSSLLPGERHRGTGADLCRDRQARKNGGQGQGLLRVQ